MEKVWTSQAGTLFAFLAFFQGIVNTFLPYDLQTAVKRFGRKFFTFFSNYVDFQVDEFDGASPNELYSAVQLHLSDSTARAARRVNLAMPKNASALTYSLGDNERIPDKFQGITVWWEFSSIERRHSSFSFWDSTPDEKRSLQLRMHKRHRNKILSDYVQHILDRAKILKEKRRDRLLYTNKKTSHDWRGRSKMWESVPFKHPSTFKTLALDPATKKKITDDLSDFAQGEEFYKRIGRAWKRGYLLYGPPGTGKSSMIAAMANFLEYDVYDLELTEVKSNAVLRELLLKTSNKSIIVIEDIDCTLELSDRAKKAKKKTEEEGKPPNPKSGSENDQASEVTLSGLLNFTDGLWSCCGSERVFVFTTNHIEKLDAALLRSGRMDMHIHMSYCTFEAFKVLAKNYLGVGDDTDTDEKFGILMEEVEKAMKGVDITPADVGEVLIRKNKDAAEALRCLVKELQERKVKKPDEHKQEEAETQAGDYEVVKKGEDFSWQEQDGSHSSS